MRDKRYIIEGVKGLKDWFAKEIEEQGSEKTEVLDLLQDVLDELNKPDPQPEIREVLPPGMCPMCHSFFCSGNCFK